MAFSKISLGNWEYFMGKCDFPQFEVDTSYGGLIYSKTALLLIFFVISRTMYLKQINWNCFNEIDIQILRL